MKTPHLVQYQGSKRMIAPKIIEFFPEKIDRLDGIYTAKNLWPRYSFTIFMYLPSFYLFSPPKPNLVRKSFPTRCAPHAPPPEGF